MMLYWQMSHGQWLYLYGTFTQSALQFTFHSPINHTLMGSNNCSNAWCWPCHLRQFGVNSLAQGHLDTWPGGALWLMDNQLKLLRHCHMSIHPAVKVIVIVIFVLLCLQRWRRSGECGEGAPGPWSKPIGWGLHSHSEGVSDSIYTCGTFVCCHSGGSAAPDSG